VCVCVYRTFIFYWLKKKEKKKKGSPALALAS
jgi:hypothetical protein